MNNYTMLAKQFVILILNNDRKIQPDGAYDIMQINSGNKEVLADHIKAIKSILEKALKELEE